MLGLEQVRLPFGPVISPTVTFQAMPITGPDPTCHDLEVRQAAVGLPTVLVSAIALIDIDGRVLIAKRPEGKAMAGLWEFPGG